jgi:hypothetical protein
MYRWVIVDAMERQNSVLQTLLPAIQSASQFDSKNGDCFSVCLERSMLALSRQSLRKVNMQPIP